MCIFLPTLALVVSPFGDRLHAIRSGQRRRQPCRLSPTFPLAGTHHPAWRGNCSTLDWSPAWTPQRLIEPEFRVQTASLAILLTFVAPAPLSAQLPVRFAAVLISLFTLSPQSLCRSMAFLGSAANFRTYTIYSFPLTGALG